MIKARENEPRKTKNKNRFEFAKGRCSEEPIVKAKKCFKAAWRLYTKGGKPDLKKLRDQGHEACHKYRHNDTKLRQCWKDIVKGYKDTLYQTVLNEIAEKEIQHYAKKYANKK